MSGPKKTEQVSWGNFYRHAWGAKRVFTAIDHYVW